MGKRTVKRRSQSANLWENVSSKCCWQSDKRKGHSATHSSPSSLSLSPRLVGYRYSCLKGCQQQINIKCSENEWLSRLMGDGGERSYKLLLGIPSIWIQNCLFVLAFRRFRLVCLSSTPPPHTPVLTSSEPIYWFIIIPADRGVNHKKQF